MFLRPTMFQSSRKQSPPSFSFVCSFWTILQKWPSISMCNCGPGFHCTAPTDPHRGPHSVVQTAHVVHLCALWRVVQDGGGKEPEVLDRPGNVHGSRQCYGFPCKKPTRESTVNVFHHGQWRHYDTRTSAHTEVASAPSSLGQVLLEYTARWSWFDKTTK